MYRLSIFNHFKQTSTTFLKEMVVSVCGNQVSCHCQLATCPPPPPVPPSACAFKAARPRGLGTVSELLHLSPVNFWWPFWSTSIAPKCPVNLVLFPFAYRVLGFSMERKGAVSWKSASSGPLQ